MFELVLVLGENSEICTTKGTDWNSVSLTVTPGSLKLAQTLSIKPNFEWFHSRVEHFLGDNLVSLGRRQAAPLVVDAAGAALRHHALLHSQPSALVCLNWEKLKITLRNLKWHETSILR